MKGSEFLKSKWIDEAKKPEAEKQIQQKLNKWNQRVHNTGIINMAKELWSYVISGQVSGTDKLIVLAALLYIISPIDLIPDFIPVVGWLDDMGVGAFAVACINRKLTDTDLGKPISGTDENIQREKTMGVSSPFMKAGFDYKDGLSYKIEDLKSVADELGEDGMRSIAEDIEARMESPFFKVMFVGRYNSGKSTLINAFLGRKYLPVNPITTRRPITYIMNGDNEKLYSESRNGEIDIHDNVKDLLDDQNRDIEEARRISLFLPTDFLSDHLCFIDTPGLEDPNQDFSNMTIQEVPYADALVMVMDISFALSGAENAFLKDLLRDDRDRKVFIVLNKADKKTSAEIKSVIDSISKHLRSLKIPENRIFTLSGEKACEKLFAQQAPDDDFISFKTALMDFLNKGSKVERERIIKQQADGLSGNLREMCKTYISLAEKTVEEKKSVLGKLSLQKDEIDSRIGKEDEAIDQKVKNLETTFRANFDDFCNQLTLDIYRRIDRATLPELRSDYELANFMKHEVRKFIEDHVEKIHDELRGYTHSRIQGIQKELQAMHFPISFERGESFIEKNPGLLIGGILVIAWPFLGLMTFAALTVGVLLGRSYLEEMIGRVIDTTEQKKVRKVIKKQLDEQMAKFRNDFKKNIHEHFVAVKADCIEKIKASITETVGPAIALAQSDINQADLKATKARQLMPRLTVS